MAGDAEKARRDRMRVAFQGAWDPSVLVRTMGEHGMSVMQEGAKATRWGKAPDTKEAYPLVADTKVDETSRTLVIRGFVFADDGRTRLSLEGDDGVTHHAKSGALNDFESLCDSLRRAFEPIPGNEGQDGAIGGDLPAVEGMPTFDMPRQPAPPDGPSHPSEGTARQNPTDAGIPQSPPYQPQQRQGWDSQLQRQAPMTQGYPLVQHQAPQPQYPSPGMPPGQMPQQQFGYGAQQAPQHQSQQGIAPGWAVQSVPNRCWMFIAISCVELILLMAESIYINFVISLIPIALFSWPAIPAIVYSFAYKNAFQQGNAQLAMVKMRMAKGWIIGAGIWCLVRVLLNLAFCSY